VIVFRNGGAFDVFGGATLDPAVILASMFGQTDGRGRRLLTSAADEAQRTGPVGAIKIREFSPTAGRGAMARTPETETETEPQRRIKIVEFEDGRAIDIGPGASAARRTAR
jgi:hypothetical protein